MVLPSGYPHDMTEEELDQSVRHFMGLLSSTDINTVMAHAAGRSDRAD